MKRMLSTAGAALAVTFLPATSFGYSVQPLPPATAIAVNTGSGNQTDPHISGSLLSYTNDATESGSEIRFQDLVTGADRAIPAAGEYDFLSGVDGSVIVYTRISPEGENAIYSLDTATGAAPTEVAPETTPSYRFAPSVGGRTVAFMDFSFTGLQEESEIAVASLDGGAAIRLTNDKLPDLVPAVSPDGSVVVWRKCSFFGVGSSCEIWRAIRAGTAWSAARLADVPYSSFQDTNGTLVVYGDGDDILVQPVGGGAATRISLAGAQNNASISRSVISFESSTDGNRDLYVYDLSRDTLYQLTATTADESLSDIWVSPSGLVRVVYQVPEGGNLNVRAYEFQLPGGSPADLLSELISLVESFNLKQGIENSLDVKLGNARQALERANAGDKATACSLLDAFVSEVAAQAGKALTVDQANQLTTKANAIKVALGCP